MPIQSFRHKGLRRLFEWDDRRKVPPEQADRLVKMMAAIDAAERIDECAAFPGWKLHALSGDLVGYWAMNVSGNWRLVFRFDDGDAFDLDLVDYH